MLIRTASEQDKAAMGKIYCFAWQRAYRGIMPQDFLNALTVENSTPKTIRPESNLVAEHNGEVVGLVNYGRAREEQAAMMGEIRAIYVLPGQWRHGAGKGLFEAAAGRMKAAGFDGFYLWVLKDNARARGFYEKMSMDKADEEKTVIIAGRELSEVKYGYRFDPRPGNQKF